MKKTLLVIPAFLLLTTFTVFAAPTPNQGTDDGGIYENDIYQAINMLLGTSYTNNSQVNSLLYSGDDSIWKNLGTEIFPSPIAAIGVGAGNINTINVYALDNPGVVQDVFGGGFTGFGLTGDGSNEYPFPAVYSPLANSTDFAWSLNSLGSDSKDWDSDPLKNEDGLDHMLTYELSGLKGKTITLSFIDGTTEEYTFDNPFLLAWEDLPGQNGIPGDGDYNDTIFLVDRVVPVPEPMTMGLLASGLVGGLFLRRRKTC